MMRYIRTMLSLILVSQLVILAGCQEEKKYKIGVSQCSSDDWRRKMNDEIILESRFLDNVDVEIRSADDDNARQIADLQYFRDNGFDLIMVAPNEAAPLTPVIKELHDAGIPVIVFDRSINDTTAYTAFQGADNLAIGAMAAREAFSQIGSGGTYVEIIGRPGSTPALHREQGFNEEARRLGLSRAGVGIGNWNAEDATRAADSLFNLYPDVKLVYAHNDRMAIAARESAQKAGLHNVKILGVDAAPEIGIRAVKDGVIDATFLYPTDGDQLMQTAVNILSGKPYKQVLMLPSPSAVTSDNAEMLLLQDKVIQEETGKIHSLQSSIDEYWRQHSMQKMFLIVCIVTLILLSAFIFMLLRAYWSRQRHHQQIEQRNKEIEQQNRELEQREKELNELYSKLEEATRSKLTFFTNVSHDLRTPLTLISDPVTQLAEATNLTPQQHTLTLLAQKNVKILMRLINQILDIQKFDHGRLNLNLINVDLGALLGDWTESFVHAAKKKHIRFEVDINKEHDMRCAVDTDKIQRVLFNLVSNAFKFTPENGVITLEASGDDSFIYIKVKDTGCGMTEDELRQVFDRFFKTDTINPHGSGIGLALSKVFVEMHGGTVKVESVKGEGSCFTVRLPKKLLDEKPERENISPSASQVEIDTVELMDVDPETPEIAADASVVLVIDDNPDICTLVKSCLEEEYCVIKAHSGIDGIRLASKYIPDLIICDVMMPKMDGFETCRRLKEEEITSHIPVLLLTACAQDSQRTEGYECGADGYMSKPFDSKMLKARCASLIENRKRIKKEHVEDKLEKKAAPRRDIDDEFYNRFIDIVEKEMGNQELSVEDISEKIGMSRVQMYRKIKALTNYSPTDVLRHTRLKKAATLLKTTEATVAEVAYNVGFSSPSYFTKCYKDHFNESPSDTQARTSKLK